MIRMTASTRMNELYPAMKSCSITLSLVILFSFLLRQDAVAQSTVQERITKVENSLTQNIQIMGTAPTNILERMKYYGVNGLSIAVIKDYKVDFVKGYGLADVASKKPVDAQTLFQAASISKSLNGLAVVKLFSERKLDLYTDINTYLKSWKFPYDSATGGLKINMANLLSHTAGLNVHGFAGYETGVALPTVIQILNGTAPANSDAVRSQFAPGTKQQYSGGGITISQLVLTDITGEPYDKYVEKTVLRPLGMKNSTFEQPVTGPVKKLLATGYDADGKEIGGKYHVYPEQAAAGLWTNPAELAKYIIDTQLALTGKPAKVLDKDATELRLTPYKNTEGSALGVFIEDNDGVKYFGHGGANEGFRCGYFGSMEDGNGLVVMLNSDNGEIIHELRNSIATVYGFKGLNKSRVVKLAEVSETELDSYSGQYQLSPELVLTVSREGKKLFAQATGQNRFEVFPETRTTFFYDTIQASMEFIKGDDGLVKELIFRQGGVIHAKKL